MSKSTWWKGVKEGRFPQPVKLSFNITAWRTNDIITLIDDLDADAVQPRLDSSRSPAGKNTSKGAN